MSQIHKMTTSPWGHSVVTERCSPCDVIMMSLWYWNYDITCISCLWGHSDTSWPHHHEVIVLSQYDVTDTQADHITMRSQRCHRMMLTLWCPVDITMISLVSHHRCEFCVMSLWYWRDITCWLGPYCIGIWAHNGAKWWCLAQSHSYDLSYKTKHCMSGGTHITGDNIPGIHTEKLKPFITVAMTTNCTLNAYNLLKHT